MPDRATDPMIQGRRPYRDRAGHHHGGGAVGERAAHEAGQDAGHLRCGQYLLNRPRALALRQRVAGRMVERLDGGGGDLVQGDPPLGHDPPAPGVVEPHEDAAGRVVVDLVEPIV